MDKTKQFYDRVLVTSVAFKNEAFGMASCD